jgi:nucleotide-binding universal stress UspA family protein
MKKILVPCDFSASAVEAFKFAVDIAIKSGGSIQVLKVIELPSYSGPLGGQSYAFDVAFLKEIREDAEAKYLLMYKKFGKGYSNISFSAEHGRVSAMFHSQVEEIKYDLVVMGTHGASGLREFLIGSNTEKIVRSSPVPVFTIHRAVTLKSIKHMVFPTTLNLDQVDFVRKLKELQIFFDAKLHVLFINTPFNFIDDKELKKYAIKNTLTNFTLNIRHSHYERDGIMTFAKEIKADMLAMPTHGRRGLSHFFSGSVTEDVVNHVQCPIWTYSIKMKN